MFLLSTYVTLLLRPFLTQTVGFVSLKRHFFFDWKPKLGFLNTTVAKERAFSTQVFSDEFSGWGVQSQNFTYFFDWICQCAVEKLGRKMFTPVFVSHRIAQSHCKIVPETRKTATLLRNRTKNSQKQQRNEPVP